MADPWSDLTETQRHQIREAHAENKQRRGAAMSGESDDLHVVDDFPGCPRWHWRVQGQEEPSGTILRSIETEGVIQAEGAGEALDWLVTHGPMWECLDTSVEFTVTIAPEPAENPAPKEG